MGMEEYIQVLFSIAPSDSSLFFVPVTIWMLISLVEHSSKIFKIVRRYGKQRD